MSNQKRTALIPVAENYAVVDFGLNGVSPIEQAAAINAGKAGVATSSVNNTYTFNNGGGNPFQGRLDIIFRDETGLGGGLNINNLTPFFDDPQYWGINFPQMANDIWNLKSDLNDLWSRMNPRNLAKIVSNGGGGGTGDTIVALVNGFFRVFGKDGCLIIDSDFPELQKMTEQIVNIEVTPELLDENGQGYFVGEIIASVKKVRGLNLECYVAVEVWDDTTSFVLRREGTHCLREDEADVTRVRSMTLYAPIICPVFTDSIVSVSAEIGIRPCGSTSVVADDQFIPI